MAEQQQGGAYYVSTPDTSQVMERADPEIVMENIIHKLRGETWTPNEGKWIENTKLKKYVNEEGISKIIAQLQTFLNYNTTLSNLDEREISRVILGYGKFNLRKSIYLHHKDWDIQLEDATAIVFIVLYPVYFALKRGYNEGDKKFLKGTIQNVIHTSSQTMMDQTKKGGIRRRLGL